jgi:hypothetical protein
MPVAVSIRLGTGTLEDVKPKIIIEKKYRTSMV